MSRTRLALLAILVLAFGVRAAYVASDLHPNYRPWLYGGMAHDIMHDGHWFQINRSAVDREIAGARRLLDVGNGGVFDYDTRLAERVVGVDLFLDGSPPHLADHITLRRGDALALRARGSRPARPPSRPAGLGRSCTQVAPRPSGRRRCVCRDLPGASYRLDRTHMRAANRWKHRRASERPFFPCWGHAAIPSLRRRHAVTTVRPCPLGMLLC